MENFTEKFLLHASDRDVILGCPWINYCCNQWMQSFSTGLLIIDQDAVIISCNTSAKQLLFANDQQMIGQAISKVFASSEEVDLLNMLDERLKWTDSANHDKAFEFQLHDRFLRVESVLIPEHENNKSKVAFSITDLTAFENVGESANKTQRKLSALTEAAVDFAIIMLDEKGIITDWSSGAEKMFEFTSKEAIGKHTEIIFTPEDRKGGIPMTEIETAKNVGRAMDERWHLKKSGVRFFVSVYEDKMQMQFATVDLNEIISEHLEELRKLSGTVKLEWRPGKIGLVNMDANRIIQVVINFVTNAIKYSPEHETIVIYTTDELEQVSSLHLHP
ncbi:MAG: PAS domain-containing sensor histidine kinase, partial [Chitinophagaceae bacterium]